MAAKRIAKNRYGNWVGYVSGQRWHEFGDHANSESDANEWLNNPNLIRNRTEQPVLTNRFKLSKGK
jgi:hypothetical protein